MKIILFYFFCIILSLNIRLLNTVIATELEKSDIKQDKTDSLEKEEKTLEESDVKLTDNNEETKNQDLYLPSQSVTADPPFLNNIQLSSELSTTAEAVTFPSTGTVVDLQNRVKYQFQNKRSNSSKLLSSFEKQNYVVHAEPRVQVQTVPEEKTSFVANTSESVQRPTQVELKKTTPQHEDIPSFSEWTQKQLAEAEKKKGDQNETSERSTRTRGKFRNKNYASPDCGAKIVAANPESLSSSAVLSSLKDEYMLNYCANRIWFVVELCEAIQAKQLDLANFELFSSSPKHFSVSVSHRFPTRDWSNVGKFTAQDSRDVQTFNLHPHLFGKFVKVELHSHYGREQFCPISWVGVYGTSEFEVLAKEDDRHLLTDEDDPYEEDLIDGHGGDSPKNLFSSATDAVLSIVKKATAPFMKTDSNETKSGSSDKSSDSKFPPCFSPRYIIVCNNCSQGFYDELFHILSCQTWNLNLLLSNSFIKRTLINSETCTRFGLDFNSLRTGAPFPCNFLENPKQEVNYVTVMLKNSVTAALCNLLAVLENKVVVNTTLGNYQTLRNLTVKTETCEVNSSKSEMPDSAKFSSPCDGDCSVQSSTLSSLLKASTFTDIFKSSEEFSKKIEPTKTLTEDEVKMLTSSNQFLEPDSKSLQEQSTDLLSVGHETSTATVTVTDTAGNKMLETDSVKQVELSFVVAKNDVEKEPETEKKCVNGTSNDSTLESIFNDINEIEEVAESSSSSVTPSATNLPAESIFLRLANRIKNLEINMSLSSTYLEELSKRYRVQLELLSKTLNITIQKVENQLKAEEEKEKKREQEIILLRMKLANLTEDVSALLREKNSWKPRASFISQHVFFISVEVLLVWTIFSYWKRFAGGKNLTENFETFKKVAKKSRRRNSLEGVKGHETPRRKTRRPSDEALDIALSRNSGEDIFKIDRKKRRRKKDSKCLINIMHVKRKTSDDISPEVVTERSKSTCVSEETQVPGMIPDDKIQVSDRFVPILYSDATSEFSSPSNKVFQSFSSPIFMKTALAARNSRLKLAFDKQSSQEQSVAIKVDQEFNKKDRKGSNGFKKYMKKFF